MSTPSCTYRIPLLDAYTGTKDQPDNVSIFYKRGNEIKIADESTMNSLGHSPFLLFQGIGRIDKAVRRIFNQSSSNVSAENSDLWNACKNLARGILQLFPLVGCATLTVYDYLKTNLYFHRKLKAELASQNQPIMGIAFDGKVVATFPPDLISNYDNPAAVLAYAWLTIIHNEIEQSGTRTRLELAEQGITSLFARSQSLDSID